MTTAMTMKRWAAVLALAAVAACGGDGARGGAKAEEAAKAAADSAATPAAVPAAPAPGPAAPSAPAPATPAAGGTITPAEARDYRLTEEKLAAWHRVQMGVARAYLRDPSQRPREQEETGTDPARILAAVERNPAAVAAIRQAGLTPRETVLITLALVNGGLGLQLQKQGRPLPADVSPANVEFVRAHLGELERMRAEREAVEARIPEATGGGGSGE